MKKLILLAGFLLLGCNGKEYDDSMALAKKYEQEIATKGYATVGTTPSGKPLYMKYVNYGWGSDRVYFSDSSITAREDCGKNCIRSVTSLNQ